MGYFFEKDRIKKLSKEDVQGLYGELFLLNSLIDKSKQNINELIKSWRGPYYDRKDFILKKVY